MLAWFRTIFEDLSCWALFPVIFLRYPPGTLPCSLSFSSFTSPLFLPPSSTVFLLSSLFFLSFCCCFICSHSPLLLLFLPLTSPFRRVIWDWSPCVPCQGQAWSRGPSANTCSLITDLILHFLKTHTLKEKVKLRITCHMCSYWLCCWIPHLLHSVVAYCANFLQPPPVQVSLFPTCEGVSCRMCIVFFFHILVIYVCWILFCISPKGVECADHEICFDSCGVQPSCFCKIQLVMHCCSDPKC